MMRSLFSAVSGLKTHQTRMDGIGNNIANVNTEAFKASSVRFSELMYQTMSTASGGDASTGTGGVNAKQVGLGVSTASTMINITGAGSSETTGYPFDLKLSDSQTENILIHHIELRERPVLFQICLDLIIDIFMSCRFDQSICKSLVLLFQMKRLFLDRL